MKKIRFLLYLVLLFVFFIQPTVTASTIDLSGYDLQLHRELDENFIHAPSGYIQDIFDLIVVLGEGACPYLEDD